jgi:hypothetical protein
MNPDIRPARIKVCITEKQLDLLEQAYADQLLHLDGPQVLRVDAVTLENLLETGLIEPATSWARGSYILTDLGRFVLRRRYQKPSPPTFSPRSARICR